MELRRNPALGPLRRCLSLSGLHEGQKKKLINPKDWNLTPSTKTEESTEQTLNPRTLFKVKFQSSQLCSTSNVDMGNVFAAKQGEKRRRTHLKLPPTATAGRSNRTVITPSLPNSHQEPLLTETACKYNFINNNSSEDRSHHIFSANFEARRLKIKTRRKTSINSVNLGSLVEERLQLQGTDLKTEPLPEMVVTSKVQ